MNGVAIFWDFMSMHQHSVDYGHACIVSVGKKELMVKNDPSSAISVEHFCLLRRLGEPRSCGRTAPPHPGVRRSPRRRRCGEGSSGRCRGRALGHGAEPRSRAEEKLFNLAMKDVDVWYCSKCTTKLLMTYLPDNVIADGDARECSESGWPTSNVTPPTF